MGLLVDSPEVQPMDEARCKLMIAQHGVTHRHMEHSAVNCGDYPAAARHAAIAAAAEFGMLLEPTSAEDGFPHLVAAAKKHGLLSRPKLEGQT